MEIGEEKEIAVRVFAFEELPKDEQKKYIKKDDLQSYQSYFTPKSYGKNFDIDQDSGIKIDDTDELNRQISNLKAQNRVLYNDNIDLINKNLEIVNFMISKKDTKNYPSLSTISEIQDSYLLAIDELTKRLNEAKSENLQNSKNSSEHIAKLQDQVSGLKDSESYKNGDLQKELMLKEKEILSLKSDLNKTVAEFEEKFKVINEENLKYKTENDEKNLEIEKLREKLKIDKEGFKKSISQIWTMHEDEIKRLKIDLESITSTSKESQAKLEARIKELDEQNLKKSSLIEADESNISYLKERVDELSQRLEEELLNGKKDTQNYKILNDKITYLIQKVIQSDKTVNEHKNMVDEANLLASKKENDLKELDDKFKAFKESSDVKIKAKEDENSKLLKEMTQLKTLADIGKRHVAIKDELETTKRRLSEILSDSEYLSNENESLRKIIQLNFKSEVPKKVVFIASVECNDMNVGSGKVTASCKNKIREFLQSYNSNYYFEIVPIVSKGNFIATSKIAKLVPKEELERINSYANFGIGRERANTAGELIRDEFGDFSRISYSNDIITSADKQGFVIKVYR
ncbi:hypothetical protein [Campylobacter sp.]|uniref:hypothetical protein n=1 Tax=Campylobacter sp. TaxID=205 RepID=UPI00270A31BA|nr:hypothetical protein [Campylobacter sp.]